MKKLFLNSLIFIFIVTFLSCKSEKKEEKKEEIVEEVSLQAITSEDFGQTVDSVQVKQFTLTNKNGLEMKVMTYGAIITSLKTPDNQGKLEDIVLGYDNLQGYIDNNPYFGAIVGRYGNRIANAKFSIDGKEYKLAENNGKNSLHGGVKGFDKVVWNATEINDVNGVGLKLTYKSIDGEEGFPGNLDITVFYTLNNEDELEVQYQAKTDKKTIVNLTQHTYFNLTAMKEDILGHELSMNASHITPVDDGLIPTGDLLPVENTPFDFRTAKTIGQDIAAEHEQIKFGNGYDHNWVLNESEDKMKLAATLFEAKSGRVVEVYTTEPGIQFYTGNFLDGSITGKNGVVYKYRSGLCLETQHYPDSPNQPEFPSTLLNPNEEYLTITKFKFSTKSIK